MATIAAAEGPGVRIPVAGATLALLPLALVVLTSVTGIWLAIRSPAHVWVDTLFDDAYYYLGVARHLSLGQGSMFAQPLETNGYQPLWLLILACVSFLVGGDRALLVAGMHLTILLLTLAFSFVAWRQEGRQWPAALTILCFSFTLLLGLETVLIPPLALLYFRANGWRRGGLGALLCLARLDVVGLIIGRELYELLVRRDIDVRANFVIATVALTYAAVNLHLFGTPVPISGLAKAVGSVPGENWRVGLLIATKSLPIFAALLLVWRVKSKLRNPMPIFASTIALACSALYYGVFSGWPIWEWYSWPKVLLFYYVVVELVHCPSSIHKKAAAATLAAVFTSVPFTHLDRFHRGMSFGKDNVRMVSLINSSALSTGTFAMGDRGGSFGYLLDDRFEFIQTEGLVANLAFLKALKSNRGVQFLDNAGTDYFVVDRGKYWRFGSVYAIPEPSQGLSARTGVMLLCFPVSSEIRALSIKSDRKIFRYADRSACPPSATALLHARQQQYRAVHMNSRWDKAPDGFFVGLE